MIRKIRRRALFGGIIPLFVLAHFGHHLVTALPVPLLPFIRNEFAMDYTQAGMVTLVFSLAYGIGQLPAGWLADRISRRIMITVGICGVALAGLLVGLSQTYLMMLFFLVLMGLLGGTYHPSAIALVSNSVEPEKRGRALGFHMIGGSGSYFLAPLIAAGIAASWGWRGSFIGLAVPTMVFGIVFYRLLGRRVVTSKTQQKKDHLHDETPSPPGRLRRLVAFLVLSTVVKAITFAVITFIPLFIVDHFGVAEETAALFLAILYSVGLWASPLGGYLSDRLGRLPVIVVSCLLTGPIIYSLNVVPYGLGLGALLLAFGMVMYVRMPAFEFYVVSETPERHRSTLLGIYYFSSMEAGGVLAPLMGSFIDRYSFYSSFSVAAAAIVVVTLVCSVFLRNSRR